MKTISCFLLFVPIFLLTSADGLGQFLVSAELRPRMEYRHGFQSLSVPDDDPAVFTSQRTRIDLSFTEPSLLLGISLQDIRVWGEVPQLNRSDVNSSVHEAWAELRLRESISLKFGRQELVYDDSRILGNVDWAQQGRSHDLVLLRIKGRGEFQVHAGFAFNQEQERNVGASYTLPGNYKTMQFVWLKETTSRNQFSLLFLNNGLEANAEKNYFSQTYGGRYHYNPGGNGVEGSAYMQTGSLPTGQKLRAWYLSARGLLRLSDHHQIVAGLEILSGTNERDMGGLVSRSFTPLYGTNHKFNGHMDYFYVGNHMNNVGLTDIYLSADYSKDRFSAGITPHLFFSQASLMDQDDLARDLPKFLGLEVDLYAGYRINDFSVLRMGYSRMFGTESMEALKGGSRTESNHWGWLMIILKPVLFRTLNQ
jgi:hypothetical protein